MPCVDTDGPNRDGEHGREGNEADLRVRTAAGIGLVQGLCLPFRGFSRSGATISTALLCGVPRSLAEDFSIALAVVLTPPVIVLELRRLLKASDRAVLTDLLMPGLVGMAFSFVAGLAALWLLSAALERGRWQLFGYYCIIASLVVFVAAYGFHLYGKWRQAAPRRCCRPISVRSGLARYRVPFLPGNGKITGNQTTRPTRAGAGRPSGKLRYELACERSGDYVLAGETVSSCGRRPALPRIGWSTRGRNRLAHLGLDPAARGSSIPTSGRPLSPSAASATPSGPARSSAFPAGAFTVPRTRGSTSSTRAR